MSWKHLRAASLRKRWNEFELPAGQIAADLAEQERLFEVSSRDWPGVSADRAGGGSLEKAALLRVRRDQATLSDTERQAFKNAVQALVDEGTYDALARLRADSAHNMFGSLGAKGLHRFLPWHRRYLWEFETELQRVDLRLRPDVLPIALPYWNWLDPFPDWLTDFLPAAEPTARGTHGNAVGRASGPVASGSVGSGHGVAAGGGVSTARSSRRGRASRADQSPSARTLDGSDLKPTHDDVRLILHGFAAQLPDAGLSDFVKFTYGLEGWGQRPDGSRLPAHNQVHSWVGGAMSRIGTSPTDPVCWLHLAQVDRLWSLWQTEHPGCGPALVGADQVLDPWPEKADDVDSPLALGYAYDL
ncbi:MAG TPA: tyrosinase family protein [Pirellulales bacterium]|jgi:tyrosinase